MTKRVLLLGVIYSLLSYVSAAQRFAQDRNSQQLQSDTRPTSTGTSLAAKRLFMTTVTLSIEE